MLWYKYIHGLHTTITMKMAAHLNKIIVPLKIKQLMPNCCQVVDSFAMLAVDDYANKNTQRHKNTFQAI